MQPMYGTIASLAVIAIYYIWRGYFRTLLRRERMLHCRVAFMLWIAVNKDDRRVFDADNELDNLELLQDVTVTG